jgi:hypothetical protein
MTFIANALSQYIIKKPDRVYGFIGTDARLLGLLQESYSVIADWFGVKDLSLEFRNLSLEFYLDPECPDLDALVIGIPTADGVDEVLRKDHALHYEYWYNFPVDIVGRVVLDFNFVEAN